MATNKGENMRCKVGDLCIVVNSHWPVNIGKLCVVTGVARSNWLDWEVELLSPMKGEAEITYDVEWQVAGSKAMTRDKDLRPIRNQEGDDEMIRIAGLPNKVKEPA